LLNGGFSLTLQGDLEFEEDKEQHSPVSVLNSPFRDEISDEEAASSFDQSLANVESKLIALSKYHLVFKRVSMQ